MARGLDSRPIDSVKHVPIFLMMPKKPPALAVQTYEHATRIAESHLRECEAWGTPKLMLIHEATIYKDYGWVFCYNSADFDPKNISTYLAGNSPFIVLKSDGSVVETCSAYSIERNLEMYEQTYSKNYLRHQK